VVDAVEPRALVADVERRLDELESLPDGGPREAAMGILQALLDLYGAGLGRIVEEIAARDDGELAEALSQDELVAHLLLLHGLHPTPVEQRVRAALEQVRPYLESHGGNVELLDVDPPAVRLRLQGSCSGCPSSTMTLKLAIENAIRKEAPEIDEVVADGAVSEQQNPLIQLQISPGLAGADGPAGPRAPDGAGAAPADPPGTWAMAGGIPELSAGGTVVRLVSGQPILFLKIQETFYGYRPVCPACEASLKEAELNGAELTCSSCGSHYDVLRAGRCLDAPDLHLEPVPLLVGEDGLVKVALAAAA
jgi:Fe-S cluster biogenesis protein NfuA/nitrite reductase/ring-hydroxylating ferredoxin subunit